MFALKLNVCVGKKTLLTISDLNLRVFVSGGIIKRDAKSPEPLQLAYVSYEDTQSHKDAPPSPLIIMHGLFGSKGNWNSMCKALHVKTQPQRKIIAVDARNHGDSPHAHEHTYEAMAFDIKALMESQRIDKVSLMGHSMGGRAVMFFALKWPNLVDRLIVADISPTSSSANLGSMSRFFDAMQSIQFGKNISLSTARARADALLARIVADKGIRAFLLTNLVQKPDGSFTWRVNIPALITNYHHIVTFPNFETDTKFEGHTTFIAGGASDYIQKRDYKNILKLFPRAQFRTIDGAGHWVHSEKPYEFLNVVLEMLNRSQI